MPGDSVFDAIERLHAELEEVRALLAGPEASVRLVLTPENVVLAEARRSFTTLSLFGYRVDGVVANRVFPDAEGDAWRAGWVAAQAKVLGEVEESFAGLQIWRSVYRSRRARRRRRAARRWPPRSTTAPTRWPPRRRTGR